MLTSGVFYNDSSLRYSAIADAISARYGNFKKDMVDEVKVSEQRK